MDKKNSAGFTLFEVIITIAILSFLAAVSVYGYVNFKKSSDLNNNVQEFASVLRTAQNKTLSSEDYNSRYGVYLNTSVSPNQYVLFKGDNYAGRDISFDQVYFLQNTIEFYGLSLGGGSEIVFDRMTGATENSGNVSIRNKADTSQSKTIYVASSGAVGFVLPVNSSDANRIKDARHIQFNYNRTIDTATENITLNFNNTKTEIIPISLHISTGELQWRGVVNVEGADQIIEINTHQLNNPNTIFSVYRDRRYNNKSLKITISGDGSGSLAEFPADGLTAISLSAYVSDFNVE